MTDIMYQVACISFVVGSIGSVAVVALIVALKNR